MGMCNCIQKADEHGKFTSKDNNSHSEPRSHNYQFKSHNLKNSPDQTRTETQAQQSEVQIQPQSDSQSPQVQIDDQKLPNHNELAQHEAQLSQKPEVQSPKVNLLAKGLIKLRIMSMKELENAIKENKLKIKVKEEQHWNTYLPEVLHKIQNKTNIGTLELALSLHKSEYDKVFEAIAELQELTVFKIMFNWILDDDDDNITNKNIEHLAKIIKRLSKLTTFCFSLESHHHKYLTEYSLEYIFDALSTLPNIINIELNLAQLDLNDDGLSIIGEGLLKLSKIEIVNVISNTHKCTEFGFSGLTRDLKENKKLKKLKLCMPEANYDPALEPFGEILSLETLELDLRKSRICDDEMVFLAKLLSNSSLLKTLIMNFQDNETLTDEGLKHLAKGFSEKSNLKFFLFNLENNKNIQNPGIESFAQGLTNAKSLEKLDLSFKYASLSDIGADKLVEGISKLTNLKTLGLELGTEFNQETLKRIAGLKNQIGK